MTDTIKFTETNKIQNSDIIKHTLFSLVTVASSKTSKDYAWSIVKRLLDELEEEYDFLKYVQIDDIKNLENTIDDIIVLGDIDSIDPHGLGHAIQRIVDTFRTRMGKKAGYFFLREFKNDLGDEYHTVIKKIGVDLRLIDLQKEIYGMQDGNYRIKDDGNANIGFLEKKD